MDIVPSKSDVYDDFDGIWKEEAGNKVLESKMCEEEVCFWKNGGSA